MLTALIINPKPILRAHARQHQVPRPRRIVIDRDSHVQRSNRNRAFGSKVCPVHLKVTCSTHAIPLVSKERHV